MATRRVVDTRQPGLKRIPDLYQDVTEGCNYVVECLTCRREGRKRRYYGETSRSPYQRGNEHSRDITEGVATHPLVAQFREDHEGNPQEILMRVLSRHITPLYS